MASFLSFAVLLFLNVPHAAGLPLRTSMMQDTALTEEFTVQLDMTAAHESSKVLGLFLSADTDIDPVKIDRISKSSVVQDWNQAHPDQQVLAGDQISKVNHISWQHDSPKFVEQLESLFSHARNMPPPSGLFALTIRRNTQSPGLAESERKKLHESPGRADPEQSNLHSEAFLKQFTVNLNMTEGHDTGKPIGVSWISDVNETPVTIGRIKSYGLLHDWNQAHPDDEVLAGDQIIKANTLKWHNNSKNFVDHLDNQFTFLRRTGSTMALSFRRPMPVNATFSKEFVVDLDTSESHDNGKPLGLKLVADEEEAPVLVEQVQRWGLIRDWNLAHPDDEVLSGDQIVKVGRKMWNGGANNFMRDIGALFKFARRENTSLKLAIRRPLKLG